MTEVPPTGPIRDADAFDPEGLIPRAATVAPLPLAVLDTGERLVLVEAEGRRPVDGLTWYAIDVDRDAATVAADFRVPVIRADA